MTGRSAQRIGALLCVGSLSFACATPCGSPPPEAAAIPLNLDFARPGLVDVSVPWGWSFQDLAWRDVEAQVAEPRGWLRLRRDQDGSPGQAVYDLNDAYADNLLAIAGTIRRDAGSRAEVRIGLRALDAEWNLQESYSAWRASGGVRAEIEPPPNSYNVQVVVEYRGTGESRAGDLALTVDGVAADRRLARPTPLDPALVEWLCRHAIPLTTTDPDDPADDLAALSALLGDERLILLGESTHGSAEFFDLKARLVRWLAQRGDRVVFVIEDHPDSAAKVDRFIQTGDGDAVTAVSDLFAFWRRQEVVELVRWMRSAISSGEANIVFRGVDMQVPLGPLGSLRSAAETLSPELARQVESKLQPMLAAWQTSWYPRREPEEYQRWGAAALEVRELLAAGGASERTLFDAHRVWQSAQISASDDIRLRDRFLAENFEWLREHEADDTRFVVWAHNTHVRLDEAAMGQWLARRYPGDVLSIGLFTNSGRYVAFNGTDLSEYSLFPGPAGSLEAALHQVGEEVFAVDLRPRGDRQVHPMADPLLHRNIGLWPVDLGFYRTVVPEGFHALLYVDRTSASRPIEPRS